MEKDYVGERPLNAHIGATEAETTGDNDHLEFPQSNHLRAMLDSEIGGPAASSTLTSTEKSSSDPLSAGNLGAEETSSHGSSPATNQSESKISYPTGLKLWVILLALISSIFLIALDMTIVATAIPAMTDEFGGLRDVAWYAAAFFMTTGGFQSTWGKIYKYFPLKAGYLTSVVIFQAGSLLCAAAPTSTAFIIGRALAGVGAAGVSSGSYTIVAFIADAKRRPAYTGILSAVYGIASVLGPLLGGVFSSAVTWRWCFYINLPVGVVPLAMITFFFHTPEISKPKKATWREKLLQLDPIGTILLMGAITTYLLAFHYGGQVYPWSSSIVIGLLVGAVLISIVLILYERWQGERAIIVPRLFTRRLIFVSALYSVLLPGALHTMIYYLPIYFQAIRGSNPIMSGVQNLPLIVAAMAGALGAGIFISATGRSTLVMIGGAALGAVGCGLCFTLNIGSSTGRWAGFELLAGLGLGAAFQVPVIVAQVSVEAADLSSATSLVLCFQTVGAALVVSAAQATFVNVMMGAVAGGVSGVDPFQVVGTGATDLRNVFEDQQLSGVLGAYLDGIQATFILGCGIAGAACLVGLVMPWKRLDTAAVKQNGGTA
ncbi:putative efflux pump gsfJ [Paramyrothecium foliicola]|nr:putative efflux pump gsfJ [Paramyrothecium foliicola]